MIIVFLIVLIAIVILIDRILSKYLHNKEEYFYDDTICAICWCSCAILICAILAVSVMSIIKNISAEGKYNANKQRYEAILYKLNTESVRDKFGLLNKEYVDEIQEWNIDYSKYKAYSENIWIGIMFPKREIEGMDVIDLNNFK